MAAVYSLTAKRVKIVLKSDDDKAKTRSERRRRHRICVSVNLIGSRSTKNICTRFLEALNIPNVWRRRHSKRRTGCGISLNPEFCHTSFRRISMYSTRARVAAAAAALLFFCASSVHATVAIDKSNCRTFDLGTFPADLTYGARIHTSCAACARNSA